MIILNFSFATIVYLFIFDKFHSFIYFFEILVDVLYTISSLATVSSSLFNFD